MAGRSWLVDSNRIATKIKSASGTSDPHRVEWKSNPTKACPNCHYIIDNTDVAQDWPGLPRGVKFDPSDQEIIWHLLAKSGTSNTKPHPFVEEFILTVNNEDGICYTHPQKLPGVKQDGSVSHFFHRAIKAYSTGTRKRRKINSDDLGDVRWHKTGRTKPVILDGVQKGCKKIMVLYTSSVKGGKPEKTNWVMHQYHLGIEEDESDGECVISKIFYQQQQQVNKKQGDKIDQELVTESNDVLLLVPKVDPVTPKSVTPDPPCIERRIVDFDLGPHPIVTFLEPSPEHPDMEFAYDDEVQPEFKKLDDEEKQVDVVNDDNNNNRNENQGEEEAKWWEGESQTLLDSQQLADGLALCDDLLQSQSPLRDENSNNEGLKVKARLSDYARLGPEHLKKDLEECQNLDIDPANIELDTPPDFRLSQLEFGSQESFLAWGGKAVDL